MSTIKFSIILPVYNGGNYLKECVNSILAQNYTNFNLHILDNYSNDGTTEWVNSLQDKRIIYLPSTKLLTIEENWARIKDIDKNEFMTMIGHDDIFLPNYLETINLLIEQYPNASLYQSHFDYIDENSKKIRGCKKMAAIENVEQFLISFLNQKIDINGTGFMMRSIDYNTLGGIPTHYPNLLYADIELWLKLTSINYKATSTETTFQYRLHNSTTKKTKTEKLNVAFEKFMQFLLKLKNEKKIPPEMINLHIEKFINNSCLSFSHRLLKAPIEFKESLSVNTILKSRLKLLNLFEIDPNFINTRQKINFKIASLLDSNSLLRNLFYWVNKKLRD